VYITGDKWNPNDDDIFPEKQSKESNEMRSIKSMASSTVGRRVGMEQPGKTRTNLDRYSEVEQVLGQISSVFWEESFYKRMVSAVKVVTTFWDDIDERIDGRQASSIITNNRHTKVTPEEISRMWSTGLDTAKDMMQVTTQLGIRTAVHPMNRRLRVDHLHLNRPVLPGTWYVDTLTFKHRSKRGNKYANVFTNGKFTKVIPISPDRIY
jgi:hypothetical protein